MIHNNPRLYWWNGIAWQATTISSNFEGEASKIRRMGFPVRIAAEKPLDKPSREERDLVDFADLNMRRGSK